MAIKNYTTFALLAIASLITINLSATSFFSPPTTAASNLQFFGIEGNRMNLSWTNGDGARRIVIAKAGATLSSIPADGIDYNANYQLGNGDELAPGEFVVYDGAGASCTVANLNHSTTYHFRIYEYNGSNSSTEYIPIPEEGSQTTLSPPAIQTSGLVFSEITGNSLKLSWTNGDGTGRIVILKEESVVSAVPQDYTSYNGNSNFGTYQISADNFVVYKGSGSFVTINNLEPEKTYYAAIFEYNGSSGPVYLSPAATNSQLTGGAPTMEASNLNFSTTEGNRLSGNLTKGNGARRLIIAKKGSPVTATPLDGTQYLASSIFGNGDEIAPGEFVLYGSSGATFNVQNLEHSSTYYLQIFEYNGTGTNTKYLTVAPLSGDQTTLFPPTTQTQNITFSNVTGNSMTINWTNGDGGSRLIVVKEASAVDVVPTNFVNYNTSTSFGNVVSQMGNDNYAVYRFSGTSVTVLNLNPNTIYHIAAFERNGNTGYVYLTPGATASQQTVGAPNTPPSNLTYSAIEGSRMRLTWTNGNGAKRLVIAKKGSAVTSAPVDGMPYTANLQFGQGDDLGSGEFVVYNGASTNVTIQGLEHSSSYYFRVFEYNGSGANSFYLTTSFESGNQSTLFPPSTPASNIIFSNLTPTSVKLNVTSGDGARRVIIAKKAAMVDVSPVHYETYYTVSAFGSSASEIGMTGNHTVFNSTGNSVTVTNLEPGVAYHFAVFEYNGFQQPVYIGTPVRADVTLPFLPTNQASNLNFNSIGAKQVQAFWTKGNGYTRIVLAKKGAPVDTTPVDGTDYVASEFFASGDELGTGNFVVYNGTGSSFTLKSLEVGSTYHFAIFEFGGTGVDATYLLPGHLGTQTTAAKPTISPSAVTVSNLTASSATIGWTNGDGTERLVVISANAPLNTIPVDGSNYSPDFRFGMGSAIGNGFVMYKGTGTSTNVINLSEGTTYYIAVFEYNGISTSPAFREIAGTENSTTSGPPSTQTSALSAAVLNATSLQLSWTNGSGQKRIVLAKEGATVDVSPNDGVDYIANAGFGSGAELGTGNFVVYAGTGDNVIISGLTENQTYYFAVFEYNFSGSATRYLQANPATLMTSVLPVQLTSFTGKAIKEGVVLKWQTATELNNDYFELQYSNNSYDFLTFAEEDGNGTSFEQINYEYLHKNVQNGTYYYRLRQVDFDGKFQFSNIIIVNQYRGKSNIQLYPNPVSQQLTIILENKHSAPVLAYISDYSGKIIQEINIPARKKMCTFDVSTLAVGVYQFKIKGKSKPITFVKK